MPESNSVMWLHAAAWNTDSLSISFPFKLIEDFHFGKVSPHIWV